MCLGIGELHICYSYRTNCLYLCFKETISEHRETFSPDCTRDLIDSFLEEMELRKKETDSAFNGKINKIHLPDIRRVLHLSAKCDAIYIFTSFDYKETC